MEDTLKTTALGLGSAGIISMGMLPDVVSVGVGVVTIVYFCVRICQNTEHPNNIL